MKKERRSRYDIKKSQREAYLMKKAGGYIRLPNNVSLTSDLKNIPRAKIFNNTVDIQIEGRLCLKTNYEYIIRQMKLISDVIKDTDQEPNIYLKKVTFITPETLFVIVGYAIYIAEVFKVGEKLKRINFFPPKEIISKRIYTEIGEGITKYFTNGNWNITKKSKDYNLNTKKFKPRNEVDFGYIDNVCHKFSKIPETNVAKALYGAIGEAVDNSLKHGFKEQYSADGPLWWLHHCHDSQGIYSVTLIDFGKGILKTVKKSARKEKSTNFAAQFRDTVDSLSNEKVLKIMFKGEHRSRTEDANQGQGLNAIFEYATIYGFEQFYCITNNCIFTSNGEDINNAMVIKMSQNFPGTLYHFKICLSKATM